MENQGTKMFHIAGHAMEKYHCENRKIIERRLKSILVDAEVSCINNGCINNIITKEFHREKVSSRTVLVDQNLKPNKMYYLESGLVRLFLKISGQKSFTLFFVSGGEFVFIPFLELSTQFRRLSLQAVSDCVVWSVEIENFKRNSICNNSLWDYLKIHFLKKFEEVVSMREYFFQSYNAKERYDILMTEDLDLISKAPDKYLASYIGVAPETYSRMKLSRKKYSKLK